MAYTYSKIATVTVGSGGVSSIDFLAIPQNYTDLVLKVSARGTRASVYDQMYFSINGGVSGDGSAKYLLGTGSAASSGNAGLQIGYADGANATASTFGNSEIYFPNYAGSNQKSASSDSVIENNGTEAEAIMMANLWPFTAAINRITLTTNSGNFVQYSSATLYGIKAEV